MTASTTSTEGGGKQRRTELKHLTYSGNFELKCTATVLACRLCSPSDEDATASAEQSVTKVEMNLDVTTMHPQGGGQPTDIGNIFSEGGAARAIIDRVSLDRETGVVTHHGRVESTTGGDLSENFSPGDSVSVAVDPSRRLVLSECHTAGHVVDSAMARCGRILPPTKGYHFLDGPYVEYKGSIPPEERGSLLTDLQAAFQDLVKDDIATTIETLSKDDAERVCNRLAKNFDFSEFGEEDVRVVTVAGWPCPCGGTHVKSTGQLIERGWSITGIKCKKGVVRVKYNLSKR
uniref:Threonyl/alanyl tRNA synthetase SAD domain-containing protein n=1 Tax=Odontella aurita TaxID=265563 RepID=A0A7S4N7J1_9STRA|mmetsp:Transcript_50985/g.153277  ORF Transcript_50985/g.153277 Transcript_50985/m.153277 type:complete len:290 (+) Transcript_50985:53-922(+)